MLYVYLPTFEKNGNLSHFDLNRSKRPLLNVVQNTHLIYWNMCMCKHMRLCICVSAENMCVLNMHAYSHIYAPLPYVFEKHSLTYFLSFSVFLFVCLTLLSNRCLSCVCVMCVCLCIRTRNSVTAHT